MVGNLEGTQVAITASLMAIQSPESPRDRDEAEWKAASDIAKHPTDYARKFFLFPRYDQVEPWFKLSPDALRTVATSNPELFGAYRNAVLDYEGACAKQLDACVWSLRTLMRMRDLPNSNTNRIDAAASPLMSLLQDSWKVPDDVLVQSAKDRSWSTKHTRQYGLLPREWRHL